MTKILIKNCDLLSLENGAANIQTNQDILIVGQRVAEIKPTALIPVEGIDKIIFAANKLAIPGLMNTHAHVPMVLFRGLVEDVSVQAWFNDYIWPMESNLTPEDVYWGEMLGIAEMIENGVTHVADHYFYMDEVAQAVTDSGIRANLCWAVFGHEGFEKLDRTCQFVERWQGKAEGRLTTWLGPHAPYTTTPEFLKECAQRSRDLRIGNHIHVSETSEQVRLNMEQYGVTPVQLLEDTGLLESPAILAHCAFPTDEDIQLMAKRRVGVGHAPKTYMKLGSGVPLLSRFLSAGIPVGLATDGAASNNSMDILEQLRVMFLCQKDLTHDSTLFSIPEALNIAFNGSARVLQMENDLGAIAPGKLADVVLVRQDGLNVFPRYNPAANLVLSSHASDVDTVICNGKVLMENRNLLTINKNEVKQQISKRLERLTQRIPSKRIALYPS